MGIEKKIKAIGFDWNGVISHARATDFQNSASKLLNTSPKEFWDSYYKFNRLVNTGVLTFNKFWSIVAEDLGRGDKFPALLELASNRPVKSVDQGVAETIKSLKRKSLKLGLLTNATKETGKIIRNTDVSKMFHTILISSDIGMIKPDPYAYRMFAEKLGVEGHELLFIDDTKRNLTSDIGITFVEYTTLEDLLNKLKEYNVL